MTQDSGRTPHPEGAASAAMPTDGAPATPETDLESFADVAAGLFGQRLPLARGYAEILADTGVSYGLVGPREVPRLWERHLLNCAVITDEFEMGSRLIDLGSGAGLPGLVIAIRRPDLEVHLVEPMLRRTNWLTVAVAELGLTNVTVHRGRAEDVAGVLTAPVVTARAVARLDKLAGWAVPLLEVQGRVVAMKGSSAHEELAETRAALVRLGLTEGVVSEHGSAVLETPVLTVDLRFGDRHAGRGRAAKERPTRRARRESANQRSRGDAGGRGPGAARRS